MLLDIRRWAFCSEFFQTFLIAFLEHSCYYKSIDKRHNPVGSYVPRIGFTPIPIAGDGDRYVPNRDWQTPPQAQVRLC